MLIGLARVASRLWPFSNVLGGEASVSTTDGRAPIAPLLELLTWASEVTGTGPDGAMDRGANTKGLGSRSVCSSATGVLVSNGVGATRRALGLNMNLLDANSLLVESLAVGATFDGVCEDEPCRGDMGEKLLLLHVFFGLGPSVGESSNGGESFAANLSTVDLIFAQPSPVRVLLQVTAVGDEILKLLPFTSVLAI